MSFEGIYNVLSRISVLSAIVPLIACFFKRKAFNPTLRALSVYFFICLVSDVCCTIFEHQDHIKNSIINCFTLLECLLICVIYFGEFQSSKLRTLVLVAISCFLLLAAHQFIVLDKFTEVDTVVCSFEAGIFIICSGIYMVLFLLAPEIKTLENYYFFWIVLANLIYFATSLVFFLLAKYIKAAPGDISDFLWAIHDFINISCYLLYTIGICQVKRK
jgi:hypothetical protein